MLVHRDMLLLAASYFCMNYVFYIFSHWLFTYLVKERGFSLPGERMAVSLPFVDRRGARGVGGLICDALCRRARPSAGVAASRR